ncbi:hypothetical protein EW026_g2979 [Hermanssonia centrifuga]|uniref:Protein kinase domain-containing protein n=1 Tax=Hermanssonia centrifuga TaxID=98765 RepID=A0A4S4KM55_9APHY|nr:hypothetical protein EW026_g2979 [Hermanssonia centrifuga]
MLPPELYGSDSLLVLIFALIRRPHESDLKKRQKRNEARVFWHRRYINHADFCVDVESMRLGAYYGDKAVVSVSGATADTDSCHNYATPRQCVAASTDAESIMSCPPLTASESAPKVSGTKTTPQSSSPSRPSMIMGPPPNPPADAPTSSRSSSSPGSTPRLQHGWFASPGSSSTINIASMTRPRGTLLVTHAQPMNRIISNPLPAVASVTFPTVPSTVSGRSKSPLRDLAKSWSAFGRRKLGGSKSGSQTPASLDQSQASGDTSRPDTRDGERRGAEEVDNTVAWWHVPSSPKNRTERKDTIPIEVTETVRERVLQATAHLLPPNASHIAREALDTAVDVTHEALSIAADVLEFAPVAGLSEAARVLLGIWEAVQQVDLNKMVCLRLTERCATMLISIREEIVEADGLISRSPPSRLLGSPGHNGSPGNRQGSPGLQHQSPKLLEASSEEKEHDTPRMSDSQRSLPGETVSASGWNAVGDELRAPLERLVAAFNQVLTFLEKQNRRPFLKRYLKRDEIQNQLTACDAALNDALGMFGLSIQIRILKQVLRADEQRQADTVKMMDAILHTPPFAFASPSLPPYPEGDILLEELSPTAAGSSQLHALDLNISPIQSSIQATLHTSIQPDNLSPSEVINTITRINTLQNNHDFARDTAELRQLLKNALSTNDDLEMIKVLQVSREEMPEAIKALQRALEAEIGKERDEREMSAIGEDGESDRQLSDSSGVSVGSMQGIVDGVLGGKVSDPETHEADASLSRRNTLDSSHTRTSSKSQDSHTTSASRSGASHDTLDREFIESGIETLLRLSIRAGKPPSSLSLPPWTITRYEVDRDVQIGMGFFSSVWRGTYKGRTVAVKILAPWTPRDTFQREVMVWRKLRHRNVLELIGASAVEADGSFGLQQDGFMAAEWNDGNEGGPWFFVSRYYERGSLVKWVKGLGKDVWDQLLDDVEKGVLRMIHEVARGMSYLHAQGVLHGDLKCANVLVDDQGHCIISDFGQSEMKSEAYRLSGTPLPHGTLRWQAPELMTGQGELTQQIDIYAFAVSCVEILAKGGVPWHLVDDATVRHLVLIDNIRPELPNLRPWSGQLGDCIQRCWDRVPSSRPPFTQIDTEISNLRRQYGWPGIEIIEDAEAHQQKEWVQWLDGVVRTKKSPNMNPRPLPNLPRALFSGVRLIAYAYRSNASLGTYSGHDVYRHAIFL